MSWPEIDLLQEYQNGLGVALHLMRWNTLAGVTCPDHSVHSTYPNLTTDEGGGKNDAQSGNLFGETSIILLPYLGPKYCNHVVNLRLTSVPTGLALCYLSHSDNPLLSHHGGVR